MSAFDEIVGSRANFGQFRPRSVMPKKEEHGFAEAAAMDFVGGLEQIADMGLTNLGIANKEQDENASNALRGMASRVSNDDFASSLRSTADTIESNSGMGDVLLKGADFFKNKAESISEEYGTDHKYDNRDFTDLVTDPEFWTNPRGATAAIANGLGTSLPFIATSMLAPEITLGTKALEAARAIPFLGRAANFALDKGIGSFINRAGAGIAINTPVDAALNSAEIARPLREQGYTYGEIGNRMGKAALEEMPMDLLANAALGGLVSGKVGRAIAGPGAGVARRTLGGIGAGALDVASEYIQEGNQQRVTNKYSNRPYGTLWNPTPDEKTAAVMGAFGAGGPAIAGTVRDAFSSSDEGVNMPTQGADIDEQVSNLKDGWSDVIPQIGGILKNKFGMDGVISSGARSAEHNAEVGGAENSYHIQRADGGDALDIVLPDGTTQEQADAIEQYFKDSGMFEEVLFHDVGSGYHLHLGGLKGGKLPNSTGDMSNFNDKQREAWKEAQWVQSQTGIPAEFIYRQWAHESGNFTSRLAQENNNFGGLTQSEPNGEENKQPDGGNYYRQFGNMHEYAQSYVNDFINRYDGKEKIKTLEDFANFLHDNGYYTDSPENYIAGMRGVEAPSGDVDMEGPITSSTRQEEAKIDTYDDVYEQFAREQMETATDAEEVDYFSGFFNSKGKFKDTPENRQKLEQDYGEELKQFAEAKAAQAPTPKAQPQESKIESQTENLDKLKAKLGKFKGRAIKRKDFNTATQINKAVQTNDVPAMQNLVNQLEGTQQTPSQNAPQPAQQTEQAQNQAESSSVLASNIYNNFVNGNIPFDDAINKLTALENKAETARDEQYLRDAIESVNMHKFDLDKNGYFRQTGGNVNGSTQSTQNPQTQADQAQNTANQNKNAESGQAEEGQVGKTSLDAFLSSLGIDPARLQAERDNIRDMHHKQLAGDEASSGKVPHLDRAINTDSTKAAGNMAMAGFVGAKGWERGQLGAALERALQDPATAQQAMDAIRQMQAEDEASYFAGDVSVQEGVGKSRKPVHIRSKDSGLTPEAQQKYNQKDWQDFANREGYKGSNEAAPHTKAKPTPKKKSKALSQYKKNVAKVVSDYRKDKITYEKAFQKIADMQVAAERVAPDEATVQEIRQVAEDGINQLNAIFEEKQGTPSQTAQEGAGEQETTAQAEEPTQEEKPAQSEAEPASNEGGEKSAQNATVEENSTVANEEKLKKDYSSMSLDELKAERQKWIDEEVDRWKKNPGGKGSNNGLIYSEYDPVTGKPTGEVTGRTSESLNPDWYQWAYKRNGGKAPAKRDYPMFADEYLRNTQEYDELVNEIERREAEPKQEKPFDELTPAEKLIRFTEIAERAYQNREYSLVELEQNLRKNEADAKKLDKDEAQKVLDAIKTVRDRHIGDSQEALNRKVDEAEKEEAKYDNDRKGPWKVISEAGAYKVARLSRFNKKKRQYESYETYSEKEYVDEMEAWDVAKELNKQEAEKGKKGAEAKSKTEPKQENAVAEEIKEPAEEKKPAQSEGKPAEKKAKPKQEKPAEQQEEPSESIFGDQEENDREMLEALGITEDEADEEVSFGNEFGDTTDEEIEALKKELQKELSKLSANPMFNPRIYTLGLQLGGKYIQKGYRTFKKWLAKMTEDLGEPIEPWAPAIWETLKTYPKGQKFDPKQVMAVSKAIGSRYEKGMTSLEDIQADMKKLLKGNYKTFAPMVEASYNGIEKFFETRKESERNVNDSTGGLASRTGEGVNKDSVGRNDESGRPSRGSKREGRQKAEHDVQQQDSAGIYDSSPSRSGKAGNSGVQAEESADRSGGTRDTELSGSVRDSYEGSVALDDGRKAEDINPAEERPVNAAAEKVSKRKANTPYKAGDLDSIKADLPMLRPEQQEDVQRIEKRLFVDKGQGFLCTNGTGTGKTYSGLGVIKRAYEQGKKNILVVAPKAEIIKQWIEAAKTDFSLDIKQLSDTKDNGGKGICITTYANFQANRELAARDWDMIVADESHTLLENKDASETSALKMLRSLTEHPRQLYNRWKLKNRTKKIRALENKLDEYESKLAKLAADHNKHKVSDSVYGERSVSLKNNIKQTEDAIAEEYRSMNDQWKEVEKQWKAIPSENKPKVLFMSATPFAYDKSIDYAEGYLFNYNEDTNPGSYHNQSGFEQFMIQKFGYRFRYGKLAKPEAQVDNRVMEIQFHDDLVDAGVMYGRQIDLPVDYDRGFLLVDGGIGNKIDEGFKFLWDNNKKYGKLAEALRKQFDTRAKRYLIESIKAKAVVPIVQEYIKSGKKVVLFHQSMKEKLNVHPFQLKNFSDRQVTEQWELFKKERPDLVGLRFDDIPAPMTTLKSAFKDALYLDGSQEHKKDRNNAVKLFQDDDSGKNLIICQQDAANAGVSLHDTTGKHQRVLINIATPERPIYAMQIEGRIYRVGSVTNAIFRYLSTGTELEKYIFANTIGSRAETSENLALGADARGLQDSFTNLFMETLDDSWERRKPGHPEEGTGGKEMDFSGKSDVTLWERAKAFYYGQQKKTSSTKAQEGKDYFATPEPIGLKMVEWLGLKDGDSALEPSAGHGAISRWFSPNTNNTIVEPSGKLAPLAQMVTPNAKVIRTGFEDFNVVNKFDGIAMNPPFGSGGKTAVDHIAKAFRHLKDGGRMVAILPDGPSANAHFDKWFYGLNKKDEQVQEPVKGGVLTADIQLPAVTFGRAGTSVATRIVVIDKHMNEAKEQEAYARGGVSVDLRGITDINELFDRMENMTVPERVTGKTASQKASAAQSESQSGSNFTTGNFKHTKTGELIPEAKFKDRVDYDTYKAVNTRAKKYGGYYSKVSRSFLFKDEGKRDEFVHAADALLGTEEKTSSNRKYSIDGKPIVGVRKYSAAWHGSPHKFDTFTLEAIGTGEGAQVHGWGLYFAKERSVSEGYRDSLADNMFISRKGEMIPYYSFDRDTTPYEEIIIRALEEHEDFSAVSVDELISEIEDEDRFEQDELTKEAVRLLKSGEITYGKKNDGSLFQVEIPDESEMLDEQRPIDDQPARYALHDILESALEDSQLRNWAKNELPASYKADMSREQVVNLLWDSMKVKNGGRDFYQGLARWAMETEGKANPKAASELLNTYGIPGITYEGGRDGRCYVVFDDQAIEIIQRLSVAKGKASKRSMDELKAEVKEAFPGAKVQESGNKLTFTMPNGQKVTVSLQGNITVNEQEEAVAKASHGFDQSASVTIEGYAETVGAEGFIALSQGSREGTGFHEAYHIAEAIAFTKKELADAKRLISENEEERADAYAKWKLERKKGSNFAKLWQKIADVAAKMAGILGYETKRNIFRKLESGEIYRRDNTARDTARRYSVDSSEGSSEKSFLDKATDKLAKKMGVKPTSGQIKVDEKAPRDKGFKPVIDYIVSSPSRIAERSKAFKLFYNMADKAMNLLTKNRTEFSRKFDKAWSLCKSQDERNKLNEVLVAGDAEEKEFTKDEIMEMGGTENVAEAYKQIRRLIRKAYNLVNEARKRPTPHSRRLTNDEINKLKENPFVDIQKISDAEDGKKLVTYKEYANWTKEYDVTPDELQQFENDNAIQILEQDENEDGTIHLKVREGISDLANKKGYIPHIFHEYMVRVKDKDGNVVEDYGYGGVLASGRNESEAIAKAEEWLKNNKLKDGETIHVAPKVFSFQSLGMDEGQYAAVMGDKDFDMMVKGIADHNEMTLAEAKEVVKGSAKKKNRHRFFGHTLQRHGANGFEQDMRWALSHYFNSAARYHAMETEFKPQAISLFERLFGDFDKKHTGLAKYVQDYISDINGNPSELEQTINEFLNQSAVWRKLVVSRYGDRAALRAVNSITRTMSYLCLGFLNTSSALLNFSQTINAAAYLGNAKYAPMIVAKGMKRKYSPQELRVIVETNVGNDIGLDSGSGYDKMRSAGGLLNAIGDKGMILFKKSEQTCRIGTTLVAYNKARAEGKSHDEAIAYSKEINRKSNFDYSVADAPNIFRRGSVISQVALQFKKYGIKEMEVVADMFPTSTKSTKAQKAIFWGMYLLTAGLLQVPLFDWWDKLFGGKDKIQKYIMEATGNSPLARQLAITAMYGLAANAGVDMSRRVGLADVIPSEGKNLVPPAINKPVSFAQDMAAGNYANAVRDVSPGLYNQYAAWVAGASEGSRGRTNGVYDDMYSKMLRAAGFTSTDERIASDIQRITYHQKDEKAKEKQKAIDEFIENPTNENAKRLKELGVKPSTVKKERERKKRSKLDRIKVDMSKEEMKRNKDLFKFAE